MPTREHGRHLRIDNQQVVAGQPRARRRSELSTKRSQSVLLFALTQFAAIGVVHPLRAATPDEPAAASQQAAQPIVQKRLTREDADLMLREAHGDIEQGRLDDAEKIITRIESSHIQYPLFHVGPTPSSLRRELARAERLRAASKSLSHDQPTGPGRFLPFSRSGGARANAATDPFAARDNNENRASTVASIAAPATPPAISGNRLPEVSAPASAYQPDRFSRPKATDNPFTSAGNTAGFNVVKTAAEAPVSDSPHNYPVVQAAGDTSPVAANPAPSRTDSVLNNPSDSNTSWALPDAPLPRGAEDRRLPSGGAGLMPLKRTASAVAPNSPSSANSSGKQQAQEKLVAARKALAVGEIDLAEKLTQAANSLGVAESQYLPDEDRPSLVAWEIAQAKQTGNRPRPSAVRLPDTTSRYETRPAAGNEMPGLPGERADAARAEDRGERLPPTSPIPPVAAHPAPVRPWDPTVQPQANGEPLMLAAVPANPVQGPPQTASAPPADELPLPMSTESETATRQSDQPKAYTPSAPDATAGKQSSTSRPKSSAQLPKSMIDSADEAQQILLRKLSAEVGKRQSEAIRLREKDPERALATLREAQQFVNESKAPESARRELLSRIDKTLHDTQEYVKAHSAEIELDKRNQAVLTAVDHDRETKIKLQQKIAEQIDEFNRLNHEQRYAEAEIIARRLHELCARSPGRRTDMDRIQDAPSRGNESRSG